MQDQLLQVDHQEKDNKGRSEIDVTCHFPSSIEHRDYYAQATFRVDWATRLKISFFFARKTSTRPLGSFLITFFQNPFEKNVWATVPRKFRPDAPRTSAQLALKHLVRRHFGFVICTFVHLPRRSRASPSTLRPRILPPSTRNILLRSTSLPSFPLALSFFSPSR